MKEQTDTTTASETAGGDPQVRWPKPPMIGTGTSTGTKEGK